MQQYSTLLNSTLLDGVALHGQTNATCAVRTRIVEIKDLGQIMILNFRPNYPLPCLRDDLPRVHECKNVEVHSQTSATLLFIHEK